MAVVNFMKFTGFSDWWLFYVGLSRVYLALDSEWYTP